MVEEAYREYGWCLHCAQPGAGQSGYCPSHEAMLDDPGYSFMGGDELGKLEWISSTPSPYGHETEN